MNSHGRAAGGSYNAIVDRYHLKAAAAAAAALLALLFLPDRALAQSTTLTIPVSSSPVLRVQVRSGTLQIRTWNQPQIQIASSDPVQVQHFEPDAVGRALGTGDIPIFSTVVLTAQGPLLLPAEDFDIGPVGMNHDGVVIRGAADDVNLVVTVPAATAFVWAMVGRGEIRMQDYRAGSFVARVHAGRIELRNVGGNGYAEAARGGIVVAASAFNRLRARTAIGNIRFEDCNARQIEVSSIDGSIAYDNGTFAPGLARFESQNGDVAIGIAGGALQIGAHSGAGKVFQSLAGARIAGTQSDAQASIGGGGPVVTASSERGNVYLYTGALKRARVPRQWRLEQKFPHNRHI